MRKCAFHLDASSHVRILPFESEDTMIRFDCYSDALTHLDRLRARFVQNEAQETGFEPIEVYRVRGGEIVKLTPVYALDCAGNPNPLESPSHWHLH